MDDDAPLSALSRPDVTQVKGKEPKVKEVKVKDVKPKEIKPKETKSAQFDDDTPLFALATPKASPKGSPVANKSKPKPNTPTLKRKKTDGSDSDSSSSSSDSSSSDSDSDAAKKKKKVPAKAKAKAAGKKTKEKDEDGEEQVEKEQHEVKKKNRNQKEEVVANILCRWWFVFPDWPPNDPEFYTAELKKRLYRKVSIQEWEWVAETDAEGLRKVYELRQFRGLFRASNGDLVDVRPSETCPCQLNLLKRSLPELYTLLVTAYENQMKELKESRYSDASLEESIQSSMTKARNKLSKSQGH